MDRRRAAVHRKGNTRAITRADRYVHDLFGLKSVRGVEKRERSIRERSEKRREMILAGNVMARNGGIWKFQPRALASSRRRGRTEKQWAETESTSR